MIRRKARKFRERVSCAGRSARIESLESRRLLAVTLSLAAGDLIVHEDTLGVNSSLSIQGVGAGMVISVSPHTLHVDSTLSFAGWSSTGANDSANGPIAGISRVIVDLADGSDQVSIPATNLPIIVQPRTAGSGANETLVLGDANTAIGAQQILQSIKFDGTNANSGTIFLYDGTDPNNIDPTVTSDSILNFAPGPIQFIPPPPTNTGGSNLFLSVLAGTGTSGFVFAQDPANTAAVNYQLEALGPGTASIEELNATSTLQVNGTTTGSERVSIGKQGSLAGIHRSVTANFSNGSGTIVVNDSSDTTAHAFDAEQDGSSLTLTEDGSEILDAADLSAFTLETGTAKNDVTFNCQASLAGFNATLQAGGTDDAFTIDGVPSGATLNLIGGAGVDAIAVNAFSVRGIFQVSNPIGKNAVTVNIPSSAAEAVGITDSAITGLNATIFALSDSQSIAVVGGSEFDNFTVTPSATAAISVDGGPFSGLPTDRLDVDVTGVTGTHLSLQNGASGEQGTYTFTNRQPVSFARLQQITPASDDLSGTVYNEQNLAPVGATTVVVDTNSNGAADAGEPTTTTAADGTFSFTGLPAGAFPLLVQSSTLTLAAPVTVNLAAGVLAPTANLAVVPLPTASAPDLVATVTVAASKAATSKPRITVKITNISSTLAAAASVQVILFASADKTVDPLDTKLLTFSTLNLKLKSKGSKTITVNGSVPLTLAAGLYSILASVDADNSVAETSESNNIAISSKTILLAPPLADLTGKFGLTPRTASKAKPLTIPLTLANTGTITAAGTIGVDFYLSTDKILDDADVKVGSALPVKAHIAAGKTQPAKFKLSLAGVTAGNYFLIAKINATKTVNEADFDNDVVVSATAIGIS